MKAIPETKNDPKKRGLVGSTPIPLISVLCITPKTKNPAGFKFREDVWNALEHEKGKNHEERIMDFDTPWTVSLVEPGPEILRLQNLGAQQSGKAGRTSNPKTNATTLENTINMEATVLLAVIDDEGMSRTKYLETVAEMQKLGDRCMGAVTVCLSQHELDASKLRHGGEPAFPLTLLHKIKFMLGQKNFKTKALDEQIDKDFEDGIIIIGAHVSHPGSGSTEHCPAVASLVFSKGDDLSFYRSAARTQPSTCTVVESYDEYNEKFRGNLGDAAKPERILKIYDPEISNLKETLTPLLTKWVKTDEQRRGLKEPSKKLPRVVFYRDSYHEVDNMTHKREVEQICSAYREVFNIDKISQPDEKLPLTYITVTKNPRHHSAPPKGEVSKDEVCVPKFTFTTSTFKKTGSENTALLHRAEDVAKYQYQVRYNGAREATKCRRPTFSMLRTLTSLLNSNSQSSETVSIALPVHYARKLARRVLSYYDYVSHKDISNFPNVALVTPFGNVTGEKMRNVVSGQLRKVIPKVDREGKEKLVRKNQEECDMWPWNKKLDEKMFFL